MLERATIEGYRRFRSLNVRGLARVNLFVGRNNAGKTCILEAVQFLLSGGDPQVINEIANRRDELAPSSPEDDRRILEVSHLFHGHLREPGSRRFKISGGKTGDEGAVEVTPARAPVLPAGDSTHSVVGEETPLSINGLETPQFGLRIETSGMFRGVSTEVYLSEHGPFIDVEGKRYSVGRARTVNIVPTQYVAANSLTTRDLARLWDQVLQAGRESYTVKAMRIIEPRISDVNFLTGESASRRIAGRGGILLGHTEGKKKTRYPLGSYGDGMRRLLALSIALTVSEGGALFVDEIDSGLHYSVIPDLWKLVVEDADRSNTQVFATTHSLDCLKGLADFCRRNPDFADDVAVHNIDENLEQSVVFTGRDIITAVDLDIEVRK